MLRRHAKTLAGPGAQVHLLAATALAAKRAGRTATLRVGMHFQHGVLERGLRPSPDRPDGDTLRGAVDNVVLLICLDAFQQPFSPL